MRETKTSKVNHLLRTGVIIADNTDTVLPNVDKNSKTTKTKHKNTKKQINHSISTWKKIKIYQTKLYTVITALENHFQATRTTQEINHHLTQVIEVDLQNNEISHKIDIVDQITKVIKIKITIHDQIQTEQNLFLHQVHIQTLGIDTIPMIDHETHHTIENEIIPIIGIKNIQIIELNIIKTTVQENFHTIDQFNKDIVIITKMDQETIHKIKTQAITKDKEIIPNLLTGIITAIDIHNIDKEVTHQSIKDKLTKYKQLKKQLQTHLVSMIQETPNYN